MNLAFFQPKKDQCDICAGHQMKNVTEEDFQKHIAKKTQARVEKETDKDMALTSDDTAVLTMDLQAVLLSPKILASAVYYKTKLCCHNFTIFNLTSKDVTCYFWHEAVGGLTADHFASCVVLYLQHKIGDNVHTVIIYSDGCGYQNRNLKLANALTWYAKHSNKTVIQKYLHKGHTQMEVDSAHSLIERRLKRNEIYSPCGYILAMQEARPSFLLK